MNDYSLKDNLIKYCLEEPSKLLLDLNLHKFGLSKKEVELSRSKYGKNVLKGSKKDTVLYRLKRAFINPYSIILLILAIISIFSDVIFASEESRSYITIIIIFTMLLISGIVRFTQEMRSKKIADSLTHLVDVESIVKRDDEWVNLNYDEIVVGDYIKLKAGDRVPADIRIVNSKDAFVSQSALTGESGAEEKTADRLIEKPKSIYDFKNILLEGSTVIGGEVEGIVIAVGSNTIYGGIKPDTNNRKNGFDKGANSIVWVLIKFMSILIPIVFVASGITKGDWLKAFLFALSVAVGLTPELLPMVITACLAKGSYSIGQKNVVVKNINAMQGFGSIDVLCLDKTGTLTNDSLILEYYLDVIGNESDKVLDYSFLSSLYSSGIENHLDNAILKIKDMLNKREHLKDIANTYVKLDELPFDYERKISTVLVKHNNEKYIICKGDIDEIVKRSKFIEYKNKTYEINDEPFKDVHEVVDEMLDDGMKVLAVAIKKVNKEKLDIEDENDLVLLGYLTFFDSPKKSCESALLKLKEQNVKTKILTGDNLNVTLSICRRLGIDSSNYLTGKDLDKLSDNDIQLAVERTNVFCELSPKQKETIVALLESNGHTVGFLGDGMNDMKAMLKADVGISVDTASHSLKEVADVILLKKDLNVLEEGIIEGRKAFNNMSKYIKITASSNFGNIISIALASIILPFFPMTSIQILLLNLLYDILCLVLPWDNVDKEMLTKPLKWSGDTLKRFMLIFGPISSIFDIITFAFLFYYLCPSLCGGSFVNLSVENQTLFISIFQTGWFIESMWTQILILHLLRTKDIPYVKSRPSWIVSIITVLGIVIFTTIAVTPIGNLLGLTSLPSIYYLFLIGNVLSYLLIITFVKKLYVKKYGELL